MILVHVFCVFLADHPKPLFIGYGGQLVLPRATLCGRRASLNRPGQQLLLGHKGHKHMLSTNHDSLRFILGIGRAIKK